MQEFAFAREDRLFCATLLSQHSVGVTSPSCAASATPSTRQTWNFVLSNPLGRHVWVSCGALQFYDYNKVQQLTAIDLSGGMLDQVRGPACFSSSSVLQAASIAWRKAQGQSLHWTLGQEGKWTSGAQVSHLKCGRVQGLLRLLTFRATRARPGVYIRPHSPNVVLACASHPTGACTGVAPITRQAHQLCAGRCHAASS